MFAELDEKVALFVEYLDSIKLSVFADPESSQRVLNGIGDKAKFSRTLPVGASDCFVFEEFTQRRIEKDSVVMRIGHHDVPLAVEAQARWFAVGDRRSVPNALESSFPVKYLNSSRHVDDVDQIEAIDHHRSWLHESAVAESSATVD